MLFWEVNLPPGIKSEKLGNHALQMGFPISSQPVELYTRYICYKYREILIYCFLFVYEVFVHIYARLSLSVYAQA